MTPRQFDLLKAINRHIENDGICPTFKKLAASMSIKSTSRIARMIRALKEGNLIKPGPGQCHTIELTDRGLKKVGSKATQCPACGHQYHSIGK